jgi:hypothetical protein
VFAVKSTYVLAAVIVVAILAGAGFYLMQMQKPAVTHLAPAPVAPAPAVPAAPVANPAPVAAQPPADCLRPGPAPVPPDGGAATDADMKLAHDVIQAFVLQLEAFQACRNAEIDHAPPSVTPERKRIWLEEGNDAVDQAHALADAFSAQLRVFHKKHPEALPAQSSQHP